MHRGNENQAAEKRVKEVVVGIQPALAAVGHATHRSVSELVMMARTHAGIWRARARLDADAD